MLLSFSTISQLLQHLEDVVCHDPPYLPADRDQRLRRTIESWFHSRRPTLDALSSCQATAFLSCLLPQVRTDRVYNVQAHTLCRILCRSLSLGTSRRADLEAYRLPGRGDLAQCLERVMRDGHHDGLKHRASATSPSLEEVDALLQSWAAQCRFSDPSLTADSGPSSSDNRSQFLSGILMRISPEEAKWLTRLILKDLGPLRLDDTHIFGVFHFLLPDLLRFQEDLRGSIEVLRGPLKQFPSFPDRRSRDEWRLRASELLQPSLGVKVGRPNFYKARSIEHCIKMLGNKEWVLERKYDGEYCEIHIDRSKISQSSGAIRIFSKSGKDSTYDRQALHEVLHRSLRLDQADCKIKHRAILLGEMVIVSMKDKHHRVMPFETIRKHIRRSGTYIGTAMDSPASPDEYVSIVLFDLLLLDDEPIMHQCIKQRRKRLKQIYQKVNGRVMSAEWKVVDFGRPESEQRLIQQFAASIADRCEGLILKPCGVPYISLGSASLSWTRSYVKLKKDYIAGLGDEADLVIVGASHHAQRANKIQSLNPTGWTDFHVACLLNKSEVVRFGVKPRFRVLTSINHEACIPARCREALNDIGRFKARTHKRDVQPVEFELRSTLSLQMDVYFNEPIVVEMLGSGYVKPPNCDFLMLRHARIQKVHEDRTWKDTDSFAEIQAKAQEARNLPASDIEDEYIKWVERLIRKGQRKRKRDLMVHSTQDKTSLSNEEHLTSCQPMHVQGNTTASRTSTEHSDQQANADARSRTPCKRRRILGELCTNRVSQSENTPLAPSQTTSRRPACSHDLNKFSSSARISIHNMGQRLNAAQISKGEAFGISASSSLLPMQGNHDCHKSNCLLHNTVVYLTPCVARTPWLVEDLLPIHQCVVITDLAFWDRDSLAHATLTSTVSESQAYAGLRKLVLAEHHRRAQVSETISQILALNRGSWRERVEIYDWRVLTLDRRISMSPEMYRIATVNESITNDGDRVERGDRNTMYSS